jgi:hypothetical protein
MNSSPENAAVLICPKRVSHFGKKKAVLLLILAISKEDGERKLGECLLCSGGSAGSLQGKVFGIVS